jgi:hypothetical protein
MNKKLGMNQPLTTLIRSGDIQACVQNSPNPVVLLAILAKMGTNIFIIKQIVTGVNQPTGLPVGSSHIGQHFYT